MYMKLQSTYKYTFIGQLQECNKPGVKRNVCFIMQLSSTPVSIDVSCFKNTRVIQKICSQHRYRALNVLKKSNLTHGKMKKHIFYQHVMFQLMRLSSLQYI